MKNVGYIMIFFLAYLFNGVMSELGLKGKATETKTTVVAMVSADSSVAVLIKDMDQFVSSVVQKGTGYDVPYWGQTEELWKALQERKQALQDKFSDDDRSTIAKLENQYQQIREKYRNKPQQTQNPKVRSS